MLYIDSSDPDLTTDDGVTYYRGIPFTGQISTLLPDQTEVETLTYADGYRHGQADGWYPDDTRRYSGTYDHGRRVFDWEYWDDNGRPVRTDTYDFAGTLRHRKRWDDNGTLVEDFDAARMAKPLVDGAVDRRDPAFATDPGDGRLRLAGHPFTGQTVEYFYAGGPIVALEWFIDGWSDGPELAWHGDGARQLAGTVTRNQPIGLWLHWHHNGALAQQNVFTGHGLLTEKQAWDDAGNPSETSETFPTTDTIILSADEVDPALPFHHEGQPFTGGLEHRSGETLLRRQEFRDGYPDGLYVEYDNGHEIRKGVNNPTGPVGCWYEFYPDGRIRCEECYDRGNRLLLRRRWDEEGALAAPITGLALEDNGTARDGNIDTSDNPVAPEFSRKASE
ncbi:toxin-antitoxin system YwqK family antitoxin [Nocardia neocaledoniensis]|uniref:toxin-antitoxin system YwqK family antitoxin n=1 Tax=Nocardia neocaledoniensis TaxID=236511 RepID=UPI0024545882|nr:hypothetical protein [Nocardia neocaledoniensis]